MQINAWISEQATHHYQFLVVDFQNIASFQTVGYYFLRKEALPQVYVKNLICAGSCISVTDEMWDITRVIPVCAVSGQAAGTAAAMADDFSRIDIKKLQKVLIDNGVVLHEDEL